MDEHWYKCEMSEMSWAKRWSNLSTYILWLAYRWAGYGSCWVLSYHLELLIEMFNDELHLIVLIISRAAATSDGVRAVVSDDE